MDERVAHDLETWSMPKADRDKWVEALRSGRFFQSREHLKTGKGYCCLGVKCEVDGIEWAEGNPYPYPIWPDHPEIKTSFYLPDEVMPRYLQGHLGLMNDKGHSFEQIADWIEKNIKVVDEK